MPFKLKPQFYIIIGVFFIIGLIAVAASVASSPKAPKATPTPDPIIVQPTPPPALISFTVKSSVGVQTIVITNQDNQAKITLTAMDLPKTLNTKNGATLTFKVNAAVGYTFNSWEFGDLQFQSQNPYTTKITEPLTMEAKFLMIPST